MAKKKVLIITYYWPPSGGGGVQRWLKFAKYLPENGWEPIIFTPENPEFPVLDESLQKDIASDLKVIKYPIWEPYKLFKKISGRPSNERVNTGLLFDDKKIVFTETISLWIRGNLLIPDPRIFWVKPAARYLRKEWGKLNPDLIVTTGPPHSIHLIGMRMQNEFKVPWIVDFRDPWSKLDFLQRFYPGKKAIKKQQNLEKKVLNSASAVLTVSPSWRKDIQGVTNKKVAVITNGFDTSDFEIMKSENQAKKFRISHMGIINSLRNPKVLWQSLTELGDEIPHFKQDLELFLAGTVDPGLLKDIKEYSLLVDKIQVVPYLPHNEVVKEYKKAACLLLLLNDSEIAKGHIPGKLFEYLASGTPILALGPIDSDVSKIIEENSAGNTIPQNNKDALKKSILEFYRKYKENIQDQQSENIKEYSRENLTKKLAGFFNEVAQES